MNVSIHHICTAPPTASCTAPPTNSSRNPTGEYAKFDDFKKLWNTSDALRYNTYMSGLTFYLYNEVSTLALKSISGVTHSVANTAKRAIIIVGCAIAFGESMAPTKMAGVNQR